MMVLLLHLSSPLPLLPLFFLCMPFSPSAHLILLPSLLSKNLGDRVPLLTSPLLYNRTGPTPTFCFFLHTRHLPSKSRLYSSLSTLSISPYPFPHHLAATSSEEGCGESIWRIPADQNQRCLAAGSPLHGTALPK